MLTKIVDDELKFEAFQLKSSDSYNNQPLTFFFSKYLSNELHIYVNLKEVEELWEIVRMVLKFMLYDDNGGRYVYANEEIKTKCIAKAGKYKTLLKSVGYEVERIPKYIKSNGVCQ